MLDAFPTRSRRIEPDRDHNFAGWAVRLPITKFAHRDLVIRVPGRREKKDLVTRIPTQKAHRDEAIPDSPIAHISCNLLEIRIEIMKSPPKSVEVLIRLSVRRKFRVLNVEVQLFARKQNRRIVYSVVLLYGYKL